MVPHGGGPFSAANQPVQSTGAGPGSSPGSGSGQLPMASRNDLQGGRALRQLWPADAAHGPAGTSGGHANRLSDQLIHFARNATGPPAILRMLGPASDITDWHITLPISFGQTTVDVFRTLLLSIFELISGCNYPHFSGCGSDCIFVRNKKHYPVVVLCSSRSSDILDCG